MAYLGLNEYEESDADEDNAGVITSERMFKIWYANGTSAVAVIAESDLPQRGDTHPSNSNLICIKRSVSAGSDDKRIFEVTCSYSSITTDTVTEEDPLKRPAKITWGSFETSVTVEKDNGGNPIDNSAGDPFQTPLMVDEAHLEVTIVRNEKSYNPDRALSIIGAVNAGSVTIAGKISAARQAKAIQYTGVSQVENDLKYWEVTYRFRFKESTWDIVLLDQGFNESTEGGTKKILDKAQKAITVPAKLDGAGKKLEGEGASFETFEILPEADFSSLGLQ